MDCIVAAVTVEWLCGFFQFFRRKALSVVVYANAEAFFVSSGCDCPLNAKDENVDAMIQATIDYRV